MILCDSRTLDFDLIISYYKVYLGIIPKYSKFYSSFSIVPVKYKLIRLLF